MTPQSNQTLNRAADLYRQGQHQAAATLCQQLLQQHPKAVDVSHLLALIHKQLGQLEQAEALFQQCLQHAPQRADIHANLGNLLAASGRPDQAEAAYRQALSLVPSFRPARLGLARLLLRKGAWSQAETEARQLLAQSDDAEAWAALGSATRHQGQIEEAEQAYRRAIELRPGYSTAHHNLGAMLTEQGRAEEALTELDAASAAGIRTPHIAVSRASNLMALHQFAEAEETLLATIGDHPGHRQAHRLLARLLFMRGQENFADAFAQAVRTQPEDVALQVYYAQMLRGAGLLERAAEALEQALAQQGAVGALLAERAALHQECGQFSAALECAQQACKTNPDAKQFDDLLIDALMSLGRADEASAILFAARQRAPNNQWYIAMEATVARLLGDPKYHRLYDYSAMVKGYTLPIPHEWSSAAQFYRDLAHALELRHPFKAQPLDQSLRHGTQTPRSLLGESEAVIQAFLKALDAPIAAYRDQLGHDPEHPLRARNKGRARLRGCWSVCLQQGGYHVNHVHSEGWLSSAYYVAVPDEVSASGERNGWLQFGQPRFPIPGAHAEHFEQPQVGRLVLFPSYMWHGTTPIHGQQARVSIAFDVVTQP